MYYQIFSSQGHDSQVFSRLRKSSMTLFLCSLLTLGFFIYTTENLTQSSLQSARAKASNTIQNLYYLVQMSTNNITQFNLNNLTAYKPSVIKHNETYIHEKRISAAVEKLPFNLVNKNVQFTKNNYFNLEYMNKVLTNYTGAVLRKPSRCRDAVDLVVLVPSSLNTSNLRTAIRETWGSIGQGQTSWLGRKLNMNLCLVFVVGVSNGTSVQNSDNEYKAYLETVEGKDNDTRNLFGGDGILFESEKYRDILQLEMIDTYKNLTRKMLLAMDWVLGHFPEAKYLLKVDQDIFVNVPLLTTFLEENGERNTVYGFIYNRLSLVKRGGRWGVKFDAYPFPKYPPYASGNAYVISLDAVAKIVNASSHYPYVPIEDAFITGILAQVTGVKLVDVAGFTNWNEKRPKATEFVSDRRYTGNHYNATFLRKAWQVIGSERSYKS